MSSASSPFVSNFWSAADTEPPGHAAGLSKLRSWIRETQEPVACNKRCTLAYAYHGGALADVRRLAFALMYALVNDCHLVGRWPMYKRGGSPFPKLSTLTTSPELRRRCYADERLGLHCYFRPISTCTLNETIAPEEHSDVNIDKRLESDKVKPFRMDHTFFPHKFLDKIIARTGLHSEVLIMGTLIAWIMRPQPELEQAIRFYGAAAGLDRPGARHRRVAVHVRHGDKHSLYSKHLKNESWRVSTESFNNWARKVAADIGAERAFLMSDDTSVVRTLTNGTDPFFDLVPAPLECLPTYKAGVFGQKRIPNAISYIKVLRSKAAGEVKDASALCGRSYMIDDGIQLFSGVVMLANSAAFVGTQISNIDAATVELMATLRHPPTFFDVLNDMHRACLSDEQVWFGGIHKYNRKISADRLAKGDGTYTLGDC